MRNVCGAMNNADIKDAASVTTGYGDSDMHLMSL